MSMDGNILGVVPVLVGPLQVLVAILPGLLLALLGGLLALFGIAVFSRRELATAQGTQ